MNSEMYKLFMKVILVVAWFKWLVQLKYIFYFFFYYLCWLYLQPVQMNHRTQTVKTIRWANSNESWSFLWLPRMEWQSKPSTSIWRNFMHSASWKDHQRFTLHWHWIIVSNKRGIWKNGNLIACSVAAIASLAHFKYV